MIRKCSKNVAPFRKKMTSHGLPMLCNGPETPIESVTNERMYLSMGAGTRGARDLKTLCTLRELNPKITSPK